MKRIMMVFFIALAFQASAANYRLNADISNSEAAFSLDCVGKWTDMDSGDKATSVATNSDDCYLLNSRMLSTSSKTSSFPGNALHIGSADAKTSGKLNVRGNFSCDDLRWHAGEIYIGSSAVKYTVAGAESRLTLDSPGAKHSLHFSSANPSAAWALVINSRLVCDYADLVLDAMLTESATNDCASSSGTPFDALLVLSGDNSGFKGKIRVSRFGHLAFAHENAAGDPDTPRADAIELADNSRLAVVKPITLNAARGITITGTNAQIHARTYSTKGTTTADCSAFELPMPITGDEYGLTKYGLTKMGDGTVTLSGAYTAGDLVVSNGTLVLAETASFPRGQKVTVCAGATLVQNVYIPAIDVDCKAGGTWIKGYSYSVPYNPDTGVSTPLDFTDGIPGDDKPLPIALSAAIKLPFHSTNRIDMAMLPSDTTATAADFVDKTPKTYGLPKTSFVIEDRDGTNYLVLVATPVVVSVKDFIWDNGSDDEGLGGSGDHWSDKQVARPGFDYLVTNSVSGLKTVFRGDSVTISTPPPSRAIQLRSAVSQVGNSTICPGSYIYPNNGSWFDFSFGATDSIFLPDDGSDLTTVFETRATNSGYGKEMRLHVNVPLSGDATVKLVGRDAAARNIYLGGDNSGFTGTFIGWSTNDNLSAYTLVHVSAREALGGPLDSFRYDSLQLQNHSHIAADSSFTLDTANRGIYVTYGGFCVTNDATMGVMLPLRVNGALYKHGAGTLALGGAVSFGTDGATVGSKNAFFVREGKVKALSDAAVAGFATTFSDGTGIVLDATADTENGFTGTIAFEDGATVYVTAEGLDRNEPSTTLPICTVAEDSLGFTLGRVRGFKGEIVKESVALGTRYSVRYERQGMMLIFR